MVRGLLFPMVLAVALLALPMAAVRANGVGGDVATHDNLRAAGLPLGGNVHVVSLVAGQGGWRPEGVGSPALSIAAFGEEGAALSAPGPLIRIFEHTTLVVRVRNMLTKPLFVHGLVPHPAQTEDPLVVPPGETLEQRFDVGAAGTYHYWGSTTSGSLAARPGAEGQLGGAFAVDRRKGRVDDRVFVLGDWSERTPAGQTRRLFTINGRSWPATEKVKGRVGQEARWRWVNPTANVHPMHLHGFYFTVHGVGTGLAQQEYSAAQAPRSVTQYLPIGGTMEMAWTPDRPGNWLFHCHMVNHISPDQRFWVASDPATATYDTHAAHDPAQSMAGLVMGITVSGEAAIHQAVDARSLALGMYRKTGPAPGTTDTYAFALSDDATGLNPQVATVPGPPIVLTRGQTVNVTIHNFLGEPTAVHWHGIELESYFDGVPGFSGDGTSVTPSIEAWASLTVRFTPPRAGTFIYHTHSHDSHQLASGLYGALIVLEPGQAFDPKIDHPVILGMNAPPDFRQPLDRLPIVVNGTRDGGLKLQGGVAHRLRFIGITTEVPILVSVIDGLDPVTWMPLAKDGADLPSAQRAERKAAMQMVAVGETHDFILPARRPGTLWLELRGPQGQFLRQLQIVVTP